MCIIDRSMPDPAIAVLSGGAVRAEGASGPRRIAEALAQLIQMKAFSCLIGAGSSYHLGLPRIREMSIVDLRELISRTETTIASSAEDLLIRLVGDRKVDLEDLLAQLQVSLAYCQRMKLEA